MRRIVSRGASKEAALYFDRVFPNDLLIAGLGHVGALAGAEDNCIPIDNPAASTKILDELVPGHADIRDIYSQNILLEWRYT